MATIMDFIVLQSYLGSGDTVAEMINNPLPTYVDGQIGLAAPVVTESIAEGVVSSAGGITAGSVVGVGDVSTAAPASESGITETTVPVVGGITPA